MLDTRLATVRDARLLLGWKNEEEVRRFSIVSREKIRYKDHLRWLREVLENPAVALYILTWNGKPCGDMRFSGGDTAIEVSVRIDRNFRNLGIASRAIPYLSKEILWGGKPLIAKIVEGNIASMRTFIRCGYRPVEYRTVPVGHYIFLHA